MANTVIAIRSSGSAAATPSLGVLANGEIALNFADGIIYYKTSSNTLGSIKTTQPAGLTTEVQFNDAGSFGGDSGFTYDKTTDTLTVAGKIIAPSLRGYNALVGIASSTTITFVVTVASKTTNHRYYGTGSGSAYFIDGIESPFITLLPGKTYRFNQEDGSNSSHPLRFYYEADRTTQYSTNVTTSGTAGSAGAYTEIVVTDTTPVVLHYQCSAHGYMGNAAQFNSNVVDTPYQITTRNGIIIGSINVALTLASAFNHANGSFGHANGSFGHANGSFNKANSATTTAEAAFNHANGAFAAANASGQLSFTTVSANGTSLVADTSSDTLTITSAVANGIFVTGTSGTDTIDIGLINSGVTATGYGDSVSIPTFVVDAKGRLTSVSNTSIRSGSTSQTGIILLQDSFTSTSTSNAATANSVKNAYDFAQASYNFANTISTGAAIDNVARTTATAAFLQANAAFGAANSANVFDYTTVSATAGTYGNSTYYPIVTVAANGRVTNVSSQISASSGASIGDVLALAIALG